MSDTHFYEPREGHRLRYDPFKAIVAPRPIGWISTIDAQGRPNLAPYSFFNAFCTAPPILGFSSQGWKHSVANIDATSEFVFNLATRELAEKMNITGADWPEGVDEMTQAGLEAAPSRVVRAPRVAASPAALECRLLSITPLHDLEGRAVDNFLVVGQVVGVHIGSAFLKDGMFDTAAAHPIARCGYASDYAEVASLFTLNRVPGREGH
ncbi:flavin reductase family protein [Terrihabitans sp. B22-R8]|uniref:flavin reductase family protein n=1 Tax=Terrihabitans sp. B22-R8 TaxID=3425128 RepID=UPI00403CDD2A